MDENNSSDENTGVVDTSSEANQAPDPIKNIKAEMNRKMDLLKREALQGQTALSQQLNLILQNLPSNNQTSHSNQSKPLHELIQEDPEAAVRQLRAEAQQAARSVVSEEVESQRVINQLSLEYPELLDNSSDLRVRAVETFERLPARIKNSPEGYEMAVRKAAAEVGMLPKDKRNNKSVDQDADTFTVGRGRAERPSQQQGNKPKIDPKTEAFAQLVGLDTSDPKVKASLEKRGQRKSWKAWSK